MCAWANMHFAVAKKKIVIVSINTRIFLIDFSHLVSPSSSKGVNIVFNIASQEVGMFYYAILNTENKISFGFL